MFFLSKAGAPNQPPALNPLQTQVKCADAQGNAASRSEAWRNDAAAHFRY
jgi:hypothetical protein